MKRLIAILLFVALVLFACSPETQTLEVTRIVEVPVEVTRIVEITRIVQVTPTSLPESAFGSAECDSYTSDIVRLAQQWQDAFEVASSTARVNLSDRVADMQEIRREVMGLNEPACAAQLAVQSKMLNMMDDGIEVFTEFMAEEDISVESAGYSIARDLFIDVMAALREHDEEPPRRIHYYVFGQTGFSVKYIDENGQFVTVESEFGRIGFDEMPAVYTAIIPEDERAAVTLFNPTHDDEEITCFILVNGQEAVDETGTEEITCELASQG